MFADTINKLDDGAEIVCEYNGESGELFITSGYSFFKSPVNTEIDKFPNFEEQQFDDSFKVDAKEMLKLIEKTQVAICDNELEYHLNGLFIHTDLQNEKKLFAVSTDSRKVAILSTENFEAEKEISGFIIPKKSLKDIKKMLVQLISNKDDDDKTIIISYTKTKVKFASKRSIIISKLIDTDFPDYKKVIPQNNNNIITCDKSTLSKAISRVSIVVQESHKGVKLSIGKNHMKLSATSINNGSANDELDVEFDSDKTIDIAFNSKSLTEIFAQFDSEKIVLYLNDSLTPILIKGTEESDRTFVLMPIRL